MGSAFSRQNTEWLFDYVGIKEPFKEAVNAPQELEVVMRRKDDKRYLFVLNFQPKEESFILKQEAKLLYTGERVQGVQSLPAYGTAVYELL